MNRGIPLLTLSVRGEAGRKRVIEAEVEARFRFFSSTGTGIPNGTRSSGLPEVKREKKFIMRDFIFRVREVIRTTGSTLWLGIG